MYISWLLKYMVVGLTYVVPPFFRRCDRLPGLSLNVEAGGIPHEGVLCIFLCSEQRHPRRL